MVVLPSLDFCLVQEKLYQNTPRLRNSRIHRNRLRMLIAEVITTIDSPEKASFVKKLGADYVLDYRKEDVRPVIEEHPPTVALDCIGGKLMGECFKNMVFGGRWINWT